MDNGCLNSPGLEMCLCDIVKYQLEFNLKAALSSSLADPFSFNFL